MLVQLLGLSAAYLVASTALLLILGRLPLPTPILRVVLIAGVAWVIGFLSGHRLQAVLPAHPGDPLVITSAAILVIALLAPWRWWAVGALTFGALVVGTVVYIAYLAQITFVLAGGPVGLLLGIALLAFEIAALGLMVLSVFEMIDALCGPNALPPRPPDPATWPTVAIQVPAHAEPPDLVIQSIQALTRLDYPGDRLVIQVIDNNTTDAALWRPLEVECERLRAAGHRVSFAHLEDWPGFKAGALNWGTSQLPDDVEILGIIDADYIVEPGWLRGSVPYFGDPSVAFVQSPQEYRDWERSEFYRAVRAGLAYFFKVGMVSRAYRNSIIFAGTMGLIRRRALEDVAGWDETIITEDAEASLRMLANGGRGIYVDTVYGRGILPLTYEGLRKQRFRWSFGGIQIIRKHWRALLPWSSSSLTQRQRRDYLLGGFWWFNDLLTLGFLLFIAATAIGVLLGRPFVVQLLAGPALVLPLLYLALSLIRYLWGLRIASRVSFLEAIAALRVNLSLAWIVTLACVRALIERRAAFLRTPKFAGSNPVQSLRLVWMEALLAIAAGVLATAVLVKAGLSTLTLTVDSLLVWSVVIYGSAVGYAVGDPTRPPAALRRKAEQQLGNPGRGGAYDLRPAMAAVLGFAILVGILVAGVGQGAPPAAAIGQGPTPSGSPAPSANPTATAIPSATPTVGPTPDPTPAPTPTPGPVSSP